MASADLLFINSTFLVICFSSSSANENHNYWLYDWDRMIIAGEDDSSHPSGYFRVFGQMLLSDEFYQLNGVICNRDLGRCVNVTEVSFIEEVGKNSQWAMLDDGVGPYPETVQLFSSDQHIIGVFSRNIPEFNHAGDFAERPELEYGSDGVPVQEAIHYLMAE